MYMYPSHMTHIGSDYKHNPGNYLVDPETRKTREREREKEEPENSTKTNLTLLLLLAVVFRSPECPTLRSGPA